MASGTLYTPAILAAATALAQWPWDDALPLRGEARSRACGSAIALGLAVDTDGRITALGLRPHACAVGQASAQVFAAAAAGKSRDELAATRAAIADWLNDQGALPDWPGFALIAPALAFPARHGAIPLAWDAALAALS